MVMIVIGDSPNTRDWPFFAQALHRQNTHIIQLLERQLLNQERIMAQNDEILTEVDDLQEAVEVISGGVDSLDKNLAAAKSRLSELEAAGVAPATVEALRRAVDGAQGIADRFKAAVDPAQPTPTEPTPAPVEDVPTDATDTTPVTDAPAAEAPADVPADGGVVAEDPASVESEPDTAQ